MTTNSHSAQRNAETEPAGSYPTAPESTPAEAPRASKRRWVWGVAIAAEILVLLILVFALAKTPGLPGGRRVGQIPDYAALIGKDRAGVQRVLRPYTLYEDSLALGSHELPAYPGAKTRIIYNLDDLDQSASRPAFQRSRASMSGANPSDAQVTVYFDGSGKCVIVDAGLSAALLTKRFGDQKLDSVASRLAGVPSVTLATPPASQVQVLESTGGQLVAGTFERSAQGLAVVASYIPWPPGPSSDSQADLGDYTFEFGTTNWLTTLAASQGQSAEAEETTPDGAQPRTSSDLLSTDALLNMDYNFPGGIPSVVHVQNGEWRNWSATEYRQFRVWDTYQRADLNRDGGADAVVRTESTRAGNWFVTSIAVVTTDENGSPQELSSVDLGDSVVIEKVSVSEGKITVQGLVHVPGDSTSGPTVHATSVFELQGDKLVAVSGDNYSVWQ